MAQILKQQNSLTVLKVFLERMVDRSDATVRLQLEVERNLRGEWEIPASFLGLLRSFAQAKEYRYSEPTANIPDDVVSGIRNALADVPDYEPLWLEIARPSGNLAMVCWEHLLRSKLGRVIMRLPYYEVDAGPVVPGLDIIICASAPEAKGYFPIREIVANVTKKLMVVLPDDSVFHVFADADDYAGLKSELGANERCRLYDPVNAESYRAADRVSGIDETPDTLTNPWLLWMADALAEQSPDAALFLCHGYLSSSQPAIALAESPMLNEDRHLARFVGPTQLMAFFRRTGIWATGLIAPPENFSILGLRQLADALAHARPGPVFVDELNRDHDLGGLATIARLLVGRDEVGDVGDSVCAYVHPSRVEDVEPLAEAERLLHGFVKHHGISSRTPTTAQMGWKSAGQRSIEKAIGDMTLSIDDPSSEQQYARQSGRENALKFLSECLDRHEDRFDTREVSA